MLDSKAHSHILIIDDFHAVLFEKLDAAGIKYHYMPDCSAEEAIVQAGNYEALMVRSKINITRSLLEKNKSLKAIFRGGAGMDNIDVEACREMNIYVRNSENANSDAVAEHAVGMLLNIAARIGKSANEVKNQIWEREKNRGFELKNKTIGIIGYGNTGSALARKLSGFEMTILAYDKYKTAFGNSFVKESNWDEIMEQADILSLHIPLSTETRYLINDSLLKKFKKPILLMNLSRGEIVVTHDVLTALKELRLIGFCTDVLEQENFKKMTDEYKKTVNEILATDNTLITPHIAGWTFESYEAIALKMAEAVIEYDLFRERNISNKHHFKEKHHEIITKQTQ